ncbi:helix-turn-helix domain-containing protein [Chryseobacterium sp. DT-3]|uniref:helix-turn-helix domain-containing protein n=1 Tax=Chryseobacterium sp. DT-3 TaxID=3396164 RepID=UPI003F1CE503
MSNIVSGGSEALNVKFYEPLYKYLLIVLLGLLVLFIVLNHKKPPKTSLGFSYLSGNSSSHKGKEDLSVSKNTPKLQDAINSDTEKHILNGLKKFENRKEFTNKGITLAYLAVQLNTNVRYLSEVVKKHKAENFKSYLHILRINFVLQKIEKDSSFSKYKISYLAEISGFPTAALFTKVFKEITGYTPTAYLLMLSERENDERDNES